MGDSRSILADLEINPDLMFQEPEKFQELCLAQAERLASIMQGKELPGDRLCRELIKTAAAKSKPLTENVKSFRTQTEDLIERSVTGHNDSPVVWDDEELAQLVVVLREQADQIEAQLNDRLISGGLSIIRSKRLASYLYQRLRVFHDKWRQAQKLFHPDVNYKVIQGMPGNYKDNAGIPFYVYMWNREEYNFHTYIVHMLDKDERFTGIREAVKTVADFHEWVRAHPESEVQIMEA